MKKAELKKMQAIDINKISKKDLKDILQFYISQTEPPIQRIVNFMNIMENPYIFRVRKTLVKVVFSRQNSAVSIQKNMENIVRNKIM